MPTAFPPVSVALCGQFKTGRDHLTYKVQKIKNVNPKNKRERVLQLRPVLPSILLTVLSWWFCNVFRASFGNCFHVTRNDPKFLDRQCKPGSDYFSMSSLIRIHTVCHPVCMFWAPFSMLNPFFFLFLFFQKSG